MNILIMMNWTIKRYWLDALNNLKIFNQMIHQSYQLLLTNQTISNSHLKRYLLRNLIKDIHIIYLISRKNPGLKNIKMIHLIITILVKCLLLKNKLEKDQHVLFIEQLELISGWILINN